MNIIEENIPIQLKCLDYIDAILYINLAHRHDRNEHILNELHKICNDESKIHRIDAIKKDVGILGCGLSHIKSLEYALSHPEWNRVLIVEDDFTFKSSNPHEISDAIVMLFENDINMDVGLLSHNPINARYHETSNNNVKKVIYSQTASSYIIRKEYIPILIENIKTGTDYIERHGRKHEYCIDIHWTSLQSRHNWYLLSPAIGYQYESYSDIENKVVAYNC